jgi:hypothetical protein
MAVVFIPNWILVTQEMKCNGETFHITTSYKQATEGTRYTGAQLQAFASQWYTSVKAQLAPALSNLVTFVQTTARDMTDAGGAEGIFVQPTGEVGTVASDNSPLSVCGTLSYRSATVGRTGRGRSYISGLPESLVNAGIFTSTLVSQLALAANAIKVFTGSSEIVASHVVASRRYVKLRPVLTSVVANQVQNQMRRLPGHRRHKKPVVTPT